MHLLLLPFALLLWAAGTAVAQDVFSGVWKKGTDAQVTINSTDWNTFTQKWGQLEKTGYLLDDYEVYFDEDKPVYFGLFSAGTGAHAAWIVSDWNDFTKKWKEFEGQGLRMHDFEAYTIDGVNWYAGIFRAGSGAHAAWITHDWNEFLTKWTGFEKEGLRMQDFESFVENGVRKYAGIFLPGTGGHAAWFTQDWNDFLKKWNEFDAQGLRLYDFEFWKDGSTWTYGGIFRPGTGGHYGWFRVDWENFRSFNHQRKKEGYMIQDIEMFSTTCPNKCMNNLILPDGTYNYGITGTSTHCEGLPGTCAGNTKTVMYNAPFYQEGGERFVRLSAVLGITQTLTLPFTDTNMWHNGWLYHDRDQPGAWHHGVDYAKSGSGGSFGVKAAAPGTVVHVGWDWWSGNTVIVSHDNGADKDRYRTIYMHLRNGAKNDCKTTWTATVPALKNNPNLQNEYKNFTNYLAATSCKQDGTGTPKLDYWGSETDTIKVKPGNKVTRGQLLAQSGDAGPGGCGCTTGPRSSPNTHLHVFFTRRDSTDNKWYFFDPYGIYGPPECYPTSATGTECARYPIAWQGGFPKFPTT